METYNKTKNNRMYRVGVGLLILLIGLNFLLKNFGIYSPDWLFSWHTFLLVLGLIIGVRRGFKGGGWLALVLIGGYFTFEEITHFDIANYAFALGLTILGLYLIFSPNIRTFRRNRFQDYPTDATDPSDPGVPPSDPNGPVFGQPLPRNASDLDVIDSVNVFSGAHHNIFSKNLKGGEVVSVFGGCDLNLTQADFQGTIIIDVVAIFGGVKIIIPPTWEVKSEVTAIFGGMDDKRSLMPYNGGERKIVIIKGVALFGGVDIRNF
jgi:predicted membrane protein